LINLYLHKNQLTGHFFLHFWDGQSRTTNLICIAFPPLLPQEPSLGLWGTSWSWRNCISLTTNFQVGFCLYFGMVSPVRPTHFSLQFYPLCRREYPWFFWKPREFDNFGTTKQSANRSFSPFFCSFGDGRTRTTKEYNSCSTSFFLLLTCYFLPLPKSQTALQEYHTTAQSLHKRFWNACASEAAHDKLNRLATSLPPRPPIRHPQPRHMLHTAARTARICIW